MVCAWFGSPVGNHPESVALGLSVKMLAVTTNYQGKEYKKLQGLIALRRLSTKTVISFHSAVVHVLKQHGAHPSLRLEREDVLALVSAQAAPEPEDEAFVDEATAAAARRVLPWGSK